MLEALENKIWVAATDLWVLQFMAGELSLPFSLIRFFLVPFWHDTVNTTIFAFHDKECFQHFIVVVISYGLRWIIGSRTSLALQALHVFDSWCTLSLSFAKHLPLVHISNTYGTII